jgi:hypothetical protein
MHIDGPVTKPHDFVLMVVFSHGPLPKNSAQFVPYTQLDTGFALTKKCGVIFLVSSTLTEWREG